ncbi:MAG: glycosyltransferase, partial [Aliifodinibius sp.]|nr:glycosyltransferase [Fodinibius sp.]NIW44346.1 glycosyltransferase [Gammaproteobacteria bacterium]NIY24347.1 glycosyltransferase [Fodinibius sp.]
AGSKLLFPNGTVQHAGVALVEDHKIPDPVAPRHIYYGMSPDHPDLHQMRTFKVLTAASLLLRREVFNSVGGYDEDFWNGYEDVDLCFKIYQKGWKLVYHPESVLIHYEKQSGKERFIKAFQNIERLHRLWKGKINPDYIIHQDGSMTEAPENAIKPYTLPAAGRAGATVPEKRFEKQDHSKATAPLVSIIILTYNQLSKTKECLQSIAQYTTSIKHEVIVVDNGSRDGTVRYLKQWVTKQPYYHLIRNSKNKGFPAGNNQGIRKARGDYILLLNNDVVVTEDWLSGLVQAIERDNSLGLVGPMTNYISGMQLERDVTYQNQKELQEFAKAYRQRHQGELQTVHRLIGFCLMIKKQVIDDIGLLDERFGKGNYEDDDFCLRANLADYKLAIAREVFIHHYGNSSFSGGNVDYLNSLAKNRDIFIEKWKDIQHP